MGKHVKIALSGFLISFVGTLPVGTLNSMAFQIAALQNVHAALSFAIAVVLVELVVVRITLSYANKINFSSKFFLYVIPIAVALLLYLAFSSFVSSGADQEMVADTALFPMIKSTILLGLLLSALNPMHIPFWMGWNSILLERKTLDTKPGMYGSYITGIGLGSMAGLMLFIFAGTYIFQNYGNFGNIIAFTMGCLYLGFSMYLLFFFYKNHLNLNIQ